MSNLVGVCLTVFVCHLALLELGGIFAVFVFVFTDVANYGPLEDAEPFMSWAFPSVKVEV